MSNEWSFFQIEPRTVDDDWAAGEYSHQMREFDVKMSNFGAMKFGTRRSDDYTEVAYGFKQKGIMEGAAAFGLHDLRASGDYEAERERNPYVWGSTVKKVRNDQFVRMGMSMGGENVLTGYDTPNHQVDEPSEDVMDTKASHGPWVSGKNYPTEGWRSFGGKYDFHVAYDGTLR